MGELIETYPGDLKTIQLALARDNFRNLLEILDQGKFPDLLPCITRYIDGQEIVIINGVHRTVMSKVLGLDAKLYISENKRDYISPTSFPEVPIEHIKEANDSMKYLFNRLKGYLSYVENEGIKNIDDLIKEYKIQTLEDIRAFADGKIDHPWALTYGNYRY